MSQALSLQQLQQIETDVLQVLHDFCEEHHLTYYLFAGTLLGAIRHNGFIPWDDDVDVLMPRPDYEKFLKLFPKHNKLAHIGLATKETPYFHLDIAKIYDKRWEVSEQCVRIPCPLGPWVDIFPLDNMGDNPQAVRKLYKQVKFWEAFKYWKMQKAPVKNFKHIMRELLLRPGLFFIPSHVLLNKIDKVAQQYASENFTKYVFNVTHTPYPPEKAMLSEWFSGKELHTFEGYQFYIPSGWHEILKNFYGDYMTPPAEHQRKAHFYGR